MNKLSKTLLITFLGLFSINPSYAFDVFSLESDTTNNVLKVYGVDLITKEKKFLTEKNLGGANPSSAGRNSYVNPNSGELVIITSESGQEAYNWRTNTWRTIDESLFPSSPHILQMPSANGNGSSEVISIGENSFKLQETSTEMKIWATDSNGRIAPINITNGSKLLIDGRDIEQSINNVGALSAALTGLPTVPTETNLACGLGTGTHGGDFAFSGGCASKVNEKLSINYAASMTIPGQDYAGDFEDTFSARAGFVWKLGKSLKSTQISLKDKKIIHEKISILEKDNESLKAKNDEIISQNKKLLAKLNNLESIASKFQSSSKIISISSKE
nr:YadA C-terminal domain-containing protein [Prochlorococcus marinus]